MRLDYPELVTFEVVSCLLKGCGRFERKSDEVGVAAAPRVQARGREIRIPAMPCWTFGDDSA